MGRLLKCSVRMVSLSGTDHESIYNNEASRSNHVSLFPEEFIVVVVVVVSNPPLSEK